MNAPVGVAWINRVGRCKEDEIRALEDDAQSVRAQTREDCIALAKRALTTAEGLGEETGTIGRRVEALAKHGQTTLQPCLLKFALPLCLQTKYYRV